MIPEINMNVLSDLELNTLLYLVDNEVDRRRKIREGSSRLQQVLSEYIEAGGDIKDLFVPPVESEGITEKDTSDEKEENDGGPEDQTGE